MNILVDAQSYIKFLTDFELCLGELHLSSHSKTQSFSLLLKAQLAC